MKKTEDCHRDFFHQHQLKNTPIRDLVIHLLESHSPLTMEKIFELVQKQMPKKKISYSTIFRILEQFLNVNIIEKIKLETETTPLYQLKHEHHHHQLVCTKCKHVITLHECPLENLDEKFAKVHHFQVHHHQFTLYGLCEDCQ
jgi:Fur family transcriptional regulator, ferric uptake regulator